MPHCWLPFKSLTRNLVAAVNDLLPICCHIGLGMPNLRLFVEDIVALLCALIDKCVIKLKLNNYQVKFATKYKSNFFLLVTFL